MSMMEITDKRGTFAWDKTQRAWLSLEEMGTTPAWTREVQTMDQTGHTRHIWDSSNEDEVEAARAMYDTLTRKGYRAFHVKKSGEEGQRMDTFDPDAEKMIMVPQLKGG